MLTYEEAYAATNPEMTEEQRKTSAEAIIAGTAANDAYWNSRSELEALKARAEGHGQVAAPPTESASTDATIDGTAEEVSLNAGGSEAQPAPAPDNPTETVALLRKQLQDAGITPTA